MSVSTPYVYATELLQVANSALTGTTGGAIDRAYVVHKIPSLDCEMIVVSLGPHTMQPIVQRTQKDAGHAHHYGWQNVLQFEILVARDCMPIGGDDGSPPTPEQHADAMRKVSEDEWAVWHAVLAAMEAGTLFTGQCGELFMDNATPLEVQGGVAGWRIALRAVVPGYVPGS